MRVILPLVLLVFLVFSCKEEEPEEVVYTPGNIHTIPYGGEGVLSSGNYSGQGTVTNVAGTKLIIDGLVTIDALSASGVVYVPAGSVLTVNSVTQLGGGSTLDVHGTLITQTYSQVGNTYLTSGKIDVNGKFTIGGGTTLFLENSKVEANELVIVGHIQAVENALTRATNWYSIIELTGAQYLNRGGGTKVCGPVLFSGNNDQGASGVAMNKVTTVALENNSNLKENFSLTPTTELYQYSDNCQPMSSLPNH